MRVKTWQGLRDDASQVADEGLLTATNVSHRVQGEIRRRPGLAHRINQGGSLVTEWTDPFGVPFLVYNAATGSLVGVKISDSSTATLISGLNSTLRGCWAKSNGRLYFCNGFDAMQVMERGDSTGTAAGIAAPAAAIGTPTATATGVVTVGTHGMRYRYYNSKSLYLSDPSSQTNITLTGNVTLSFSIGAAGTNIIRSTDGKVDQVIVELTDAGSSAFYRAATVNQVLTGAEVNFVDTDLINQVAATRDGDFGHQQPPIFALAVEHRGRVFGWGQITVGLTTLTVATGSTTMSVTGSQMSPNWAGFLVRVGTDSKAYRITAVSGTTKIIVSEGYTGAASSTATATVFHAQPDLLYWSRSGFPESYNPLSFARRVLQNASDSPAGLYSNTEILYLFGQRTVRALDYTTDPAAGKLLQVASEFGLWNQHCLVEANGRIYGWGRSGAWYLSDLDAVHISRPVDDRIDGTDSSSSDIVDVTKSEQFHGVFDPWERCITWHYGTAAEDFCSHALRYDIERKTWSIGTRKQALKASSQTTGGTTNRTRAVVVDTNGYTWYLTPGVFDGSSYSGSVLVVSTTGATTTAIPVTVPLTTGTNDLRGVIATYSGQDIQVISNTSTTLMLNSALTAAPTIGSEVFLGVIAFTISTKWVALTDLVNKQRPSYLVIKMVPGTATGQLTLKFYTDFSTTPVTLTKGASDTLPDGLSWTNGATFASVDLDCGSGDGMVAMPLTMQFHRAIRAELSSTRPDGLIRVLDLAFIAKTARSDSPDEDE